MVERYHAITLWQPWGTLIAEGAKTMEFRRYRAPDFVVGRRIAIHAGARDMRLDEVMQLMAQVEARSPDTTALDRARALPLLKEIIENGARGKSRATWRSAAAPLGCIVCLATLGVPLSPDAVRERFANDSDRDEHFSWGWPLTDIEPLRPPVPATGAQGFWSWERRDA